MPSTLLRALAAWQVYRYMYNDVLRVDDVSHLLDLDGIKVTNLQRLPASVAALDSSMCAFGRRQLRKHCSNCPPHVRVCGPCKVL